jgi:anti-anti-sigma factor
VDTTRPLLLDGQAVLERARSLCDAALLTCAHARAARRYFDRPSSAGTLGFATGAGTRIDLARHGDGYVVVEVVGVVDILSGPRLTDVLTMAVDSGEPAVIVDLSAVTLLAAAGYESLRNAANELSDRDGHLHVVCPSTSPAARVLQILGHGCGWLRHSDVPAAVATVMERA